jgi:hypothetical protein
MSFHGGEDSCLVLHIYGRIPTFQRSMLPSSLRPRKTLLEVKSVYEIYVNYA